MIYYLKETKVPTVDNHKQFVDPKNIYFTVKNSASGGFEVVRGVEGEYKSLEIVGNSNNVKYLGLNGAELNGSNGKIENVIKYSHYCQ